ncbi:MAG TPA: MFS transporter, partial [Blastocatellia bacterium]|nr:MFS transporter [Blastocatellia bacterium]
EIPGTLIVERWSARKWIARIMISWGLVASLMGFIGMWPLNFISTTQQFYWLRLILGAAEAGFFPGVIVYLSHWFRYADRGKAKSKFMIGIPLATIIGVPISWLILENINWYGLAGWRWVFILEGIPSIILGFVTLFYLTDRPHQAKWLPEDEKAWLVGELKRESEQIEAAKKVSTWEAFKHPQILLLATIYFLAVTGNYGLNIFLPSITGNLKGMSSVARAVVTTLPYICSLIGMLTLGPLADRKGKRRWQIAVPLLAAGIGYSASVVTGDYLALAILSLCLAGCAQAGWPVFWSLPTAVLTKSAAAVAVGLINSVGNLGGFIGPYAVGYLKTRTGSFNAGMLFLAACAFLAAILTAFLRPPKKV